MLCNERKYKYIVPVRVRRYIRRIFNITFLSYFFFSLCIGLRCNEMLWIFNISIKMQKNDFLTDYWIFCLFFLSFCWDSEEIHVIFCHFTYIISLYVSYVYMVIRLFVTTLHDDRLYFLRSRTRIIRVIKQLDRNDDRTSVACATQRFVSSVTASFEASVLVLDCYRCPHLWPVQWCRIRWWRFRRSIRCSSPARISL